MLIEVGSGFARRCPYGDAHFGHLTIEIATAAVVAAAVAAAAAALTAAAPAAAASSAPKADLFVSKEIVVVFNPSNN